MKKRRILEVKRQHYVPRFYLQGFADRKNQIAVYDKVDDRSYRSNIANEAAERGFYDIPEFGKKRKEDKQIVEKYLGQIEGHAGDRIRDIFDRVEADTADAITDDTFMADLAFFIAAQYLRTPEMRQDTIASSIELQKVLFRIHLQVKYPELADAEFDLTLDEKKHPLHHALMSLNPTFILEVAEVLLSHIWIVMVNRTGVQFITSDNPVVLHREKGYLSARGIGVGSPGVEVFLPLGPTAGILLLERRRYFTLAPAHGRILHLTDSAVALNFNTLQVFGSTRKVYSGSDDFSMVKTICSDHPELRDLTRAKVEVNTLYPRTDWSGRSEKDELLIQLKKRP